MVHGLQSHKRSKRHTEFNWADSPRAGRITNRSTEVST
jgi:hypothetical protein